MCSFMQRTCCGYQATGRPIRGYALPEESDGLISLSSSPKLACTRKDEGGLLRIVVQAGDYIEYALWCHSHSSQDGSGFVLLRHLRIRRPEEGGSPRRTGNKNSADYISANATGLDKISEDTRPPDYLPAAVIVISCR